VTAEYIAKNAKKEDAEFAKNPQKTQKNEVKKLRRCEVKE
jgi:hypothetical protein